MITLVGRRPLSPAARRRLALLLPVAYALLESWLLDRDTVWWKNALNCVAALGLLLRLRWPAVSMVLALPGTFFTESWLAPMTALYSVAADRRRLPVPVLCAAAFGLCDYFTWSVTGQNSGVDPLALTQSNGLAVMQSVLLGTAPVALGMLARTRRELTLRLEQLTLGQRREARLLAERVLATERARLAREMHDVVSHQVSLISVQAGGLQVSTTDPAAARTAQTIRELSVRTLQELRQMVGVLRAAGGASLPGPGGPSGPPQAPQPRLADLPRLVEDSGLVAGNGLLMDHGLCGRDELDPDGRQWPEAVQRAAYRTVQEALTNISKHAPGSQVRITVSERAGRLLVEVRNGPAPSRPDRGAPLPGGGHGLVGLRERAQLLGGQLTAEPTADRGFLVRAVLPAGGR
ncbi:sensor histidine kinase [Kitasatospora sp. GAS204B]|uniref:sensor histidine kinase n=1 Tax=unclassified Kitasatospora TaxID=2633591 RepID=UPI0024757958|nr:histidine kinase [Kitasatospora sp. GAS204B]MDH6119627.1 signal transduction histidine kinase [Kitasatospora sp. GAS204B]